MLRRNGQKRGHISPIPASLRYRRYSILSCINQVNHVERLISARFKTGVSVGPSRPTANASEFYPNHNPVWSAKTPSQTKPASILVQSGGLLGLEPCRRKLALKLDPFMRS